MVEADLSQVEERLMSDSNLYEELLILEDETIDRYVRDQMSDADRASFESYFLQSSEHRQKLRFARALGTYVDRANAEVGDIEAEPVAHAPSATEPDNPGRIYAPAQSRRFSFWPFQSPVLNYGLALGLIIAVGGLAWIAFKGFRPSGPGRVFEATLVPGGLTREGSGEIQTITIPPGMDSLRVRLILPVEHYEDYKIELLSSDSSSVLTRDQLKSTEESGKNVLFVDVPANLRRDTYRLKLSARSTGAYEEITSYTFRIQ